MVFTAAVVKCTQHLIAWGLWCWNMIILVSLLHQAYLINSKSIWVKHIELSGLKGKEPNWKANSCQVMHKPTCVDSMLGLSLLHGSLSLINNASCGSLNRKKGHLGQVLKYVQLKSWWVVLYLLANMSKKEGEEAWRGVKEGEKQWGD